jgi:Leucine-rich repeat (LRR) protein
LFLSTLKKQFLQTVNQLLRTKMIDKLSDDIIYKIYEYCLTFGTFKLINKSISDLFNAREHLINFTGIFHKNNVAWHLSCLRTVRLTNQTGFIFFPSSLRVLNLIGLGLDSFQASADNLEELYIDDNELVHISGLPNTLRILTCSHNDLIDLDNLPNKLIKLVVDDNWLSVLTRLPNTLEHLSICSNYMNRLNVPQGLKVLKISCNCIVDLVLPNKLEELEMVSCPLIIFKIPESLRKLTCCKFSIEPGLRKIINDKKSLGIFDLRLIGYMTFNEYSQQLINNHEN